MARRHLVRRGQPVRPAAELGPDARPAPVRRPPDQPRPDRVERDVAQSRAQMRLVHRHAAEPPLPEMARPPQPGMNVPRIAAMHRRQRAADPVGIGGHEDEMDMVGHQHPGPDRDAGRGGVGGEQVAVERVIRLGEEGRRPAVAALGDMVRMPRKDGAGETSHADWLGLTRADVNLVHCHRNHVTVINCHRNHVTVIMSP